MSDPKPMDERQLKKAKMMLRVIGAVLILAGLSAVLFGLFDAVTGWGLIGAGFVLAIGAGEITKKIVEAQKK